MKKQIQTDEIKEIYHLLEDDLSEYIFENRLMYSLTEDMKYLRNIVCTIEKGKEIYNRLKLEKRQIGIFGAGDVGGHLIRVYYHLKFKCFIDNKRAGTIYEGLPVFSLKEFKEKYPDGVVIISTKLYYKEIMQQLLEENFSEDRIVNIGMEYAKLNHLQYFDLPQLEEKRISKEVFIDGGSYDGSTSVDFKSWCGVRGGVCVCMGT